MTPSADLFAWLGAPLLVVGLGWAARRGGRDSVPAITRALGSRLAPLAFGVVTSLFVWWVWGSLSERGFLHDEAAYLLQAEIFASGRLSAPAPPLPEFFEQFHVLVTPRLAPKYPPGHALLLAAGVALDLAGLVPVALQGVSGGLLFALARRLAGGATAALAWLVWLSAPLLNAWRTTYLSQSTSTALWLLAAWLLLRFVERERTADLLALGAVVGWLGITRPLTAVALAAPIAAVVLAHCWRRRRVGGLLPAAAAGGLVLAILPLWSASSTGDFRSLPYTLYSRVYFPFQKLGFGVDPAPPLRELPPDMALYAADTRGIHAVHTPQRLPLALLGRLAGAGNEMWGEARWRSPLSAFFLVGLFALDRRGRFGLAAALALFAVYAAYAHPPYWAVYYHEAQPVVAFTVAAGVGALLRLGARRPWRVGTSEAPELALPSVGLLVVGLGLGLGDAGATRVQARERLLYHHGFDRTLAAIPDEKAVVFVRYGPGHNPHRSLVENRPDAGAARVWVVHDRGEDDTRLLRLAEGRVPYLFDEASFRLYRLPAPPG